MNYSTYAFRLFLFIFSINSIFSSESSLQLRARVPAIATMQVQFNQNQMTVTRKSNLFGNLMDSNLRIEVEDGSQVFQKKALIHESTHAFIDLSARQSDSIKISFIQQ